MRALLSSLVVVIAMATGSPAAATPADVLVLLDTSGSMRKAQGTGTRLDAAKKLATEVINAVSQKHRVGLARFAQLDTVVQGGEGKRVAHAEDQEQCDHAANLLAPLSVAGAAQALRWLDGVEELGNPELVALGDSPLVRATEVAVEYLRNKRKSDPLRHCVNAYLVVITDGEDTCAGGGEIRSGLAELAAKASKEDIHALVLSYTPDAEAARSVARIGQAETAKPLGPDEGSKLVEAVKAIQGHLAPEACLASGVKANQIGVGQTPGADAAVDPKCAATAGDDGCGCTVAERPRGRLALLLVLLAVLLGVAAARRRSGRALLVLMITIACGAGLPLLSGCSDDAAPGCPRDGGVEAGGPPAGKLVEPAKVQSDALTRLATLLAAAEEARTAVLAPLLSPEKVFAAQKDANGCIELARSIGLELYPTAQRGPAGCLATRRCNSLDKSLLLQACLKAKGVTAELVGCALEPGFKQKLRAEAAKPPTYPDLASITAREQELVKKLFPADPNAPTQLAALLDARDKGLSKYFAENVQKEVGLLEPLAKLDAAATAAGVEARIDEALQGHFFLLVDGKPVDPSLKGSDAETGACVGAPPELDEETLQMQVQVLATYAEPAWFEDSVVVAERTVRPHTLFGETLSVGLADASAAQLPAGLPAPSGTGCLRAFIEVGSDRVRGEPFFIGSSDAAACPATPLVPAAEGKHLARVELRITTRYGNTGASFTALRTLVDRYGYVLEPPMGEASGPMYSNTTARQLLPMRIDLPLVSGLLSPAALLDARLRDLVARKAEIEAAVATRVGLPVTPAPPSPPGILPLAVVGTVVRYSPPLLGSGLTLIAERPWLVSHLHRRGFGVSGAALDVVEQTILDVLDAPLLVSGTDAAARLKAQIGIGALITEAEAAAVAAWEKVNVTNAGRMLRDPKLAGKWSAMDPGTLDPLVFPHSVREAAKLHSTEAFVVTTGVATEDEDPQIAWFRFDKETGRTLSEVRYDGTFYGGAAGVKLIIDIDKCLFTAAAEMLGGAESCDVNPCLKAAWENYAKNVAQDYAMGALFALGGALGLGESAIWGYAELGLEVMGNANDLVEAGQLPKCD